MKKTIIASIILAAALAVAGCGSNEAAETQAPDAQVPVVETQAPAASETGLAPEVAGEGQADPNAFPTGIPLNEDNYAEFLDESGNPQPVMYEVIEDCITWSGNDVQTSGGDLVQGSIVSAVATDGNYLILDDERVVEASHLQQFQ